MPLRRIAIVLIVLAVAATGAFLALTFLGDKEARRPLARPNFKIVETRAVDPRDRPESQQRATEQATLVVKMLNEYYRLAMLRPSIWAPDPKASPPPTRGADRLATFFSAEAQPALAQNLDALAVADLGKSLERVDPTRQDATKLSVEFEEDGSTPLAVVTVSFAADGTTKKRDEGGRAKVKIVHTANFWLVLEAGAYKIFAYTVELKADELTKTAAFGIRGALS